MACVPVLAALLLSSISANPDSCPPFVKHYLNLGLLRPENYTGECPSIAVSSEASCLEEYCTIRQASVKKCSPNAVQFTDLGTESICYLLQLEECTPKTGCSFIRSENHAIHITDQITPDNTDHGDRVCDRRRCNDGQCLDLLAPWCDGVEDCGDGSDEINCDGKCDSIDVFSCSSDSECIPASRRCDGELACADGSDEMGCEEYLRRRNTNDTMLITAVAVGSVLSLLLLVLMFACGQNLYRRHMERATRLRSLRLGSSGADYVVRLLPGESPFQDTLPPPYTNCVVPPRDAPPTYESPTALDRLLDIAESSGYVSRARPKPPECDTESSEIVSCPSPASSLGKERSGDETLTHVVSPYPREARDGAGVRDSSQGETGCSSLEQGVEGEEEDDRIAEE